MRAVQLIVARGLAPTRSAAQRLIGHGGVRWLAPGGWAVPRKAGEDLPGDCSLQVIDDAELRFVSRGGLKLEAALAHGAIGVEGRVCLDIGQGTGGFTDVLLRRGAAHVVGLDVGHGQLHARLRADPRVTAFEGLNVRDDTGVSLESLNVGDDAWRAFQRALPSGGFGAVVADLSFISLTHALPAVARRLARDGVALLLVKPQFELQPRDIGKNGLVRDAAAYPRVEARIRERCVELGLAVHDWFASAIDGGDGNREFFVHLRQADLQAR